MISVQYSTDSTMADTANDFTNGLSTGMATQTWHEVSTGVLIEHSTSDLQTTIETSLQTLGHDELNEDRELSEEVMEIYDDRAFIDQDPTHAFPYLTAVILSLVVGTFGNLMIVAAHVKYKRLRKTGNIMVINLALADLCVTAIADPMCILGTLKGKQFFDGVPWLCELIASLCLTACFCAFFNLSVITLSRFLFVCYNDYYHQVFTKKKTIFFCIFVWIAAFGFEMPNFIGWGDHYFDQKNHQCIWDRRASRSYSLFVAIVLIMTPLVTMVMAYAIIFLKIFRTKKEIMKFDDEKKDGQKSLLRKEWMETFRSCRTMCCIVVAFVICWTPYAVVIAVDYADTLPTWVHLWVTFLAHFHSVVNFFIYLGNKEYNEAFTDMLCCQRKPDGRGFTTTSSSMSKSTKLESSTTNSRY